MSRDCPISLGITTGCNVTLLAEIQAVHRFTFTFLPDIGLSVQRATMSVTMNVRHRRDALGPSRTSISARDAHSTPLRPGSAPLLRACLLVFIRSMGQR